MPPVGRNHMKYLRERQKGKSLEKVDKGVWGMPWLPEAMKDVISCDKLR